ncbi:DNA alkylation repair protein [Marivivens sp. LCG002]|uniref:DNA alkylation repair protein n=1 Tax=Marivivens sp. LCG002 TaxID=3051171 RepID=UPI002554EACD|nr:DNA alkylation repair protein [Marivivens sp. LCG002]WIV51691.1 DNA alkylation repair protein [Marivivens sp. LCG002]
METGATSVNIDQALTALEALADAEKAPELLAYHKVERPYLGVSNPQIDDLTKEWRAACTLEERLELASALWATNIHEARIAAAKLLTQARIRPDDTAAWELIKSWVPDFDAWAIADHVAIAGQKRLSADPTRLDEIEPWTVSPHMWSRRAVLVMTLPWTKITHPKPEEIAARERILSWAAGYVDDREWFIQKAIGWWLRDLGKRDPERVKAFIADYGPRMKAFARKEALRQLKD